MLSHGGDPDQRHAGHRGGTGIHVVSCLLAYRTGFAGQHRLVEFQSPRLDDGAVGRHLFAGTDPQQIVKHDVVVRHLHIRAVAVHQIVRRHKDGQLVQGAFGFQFGDDADARVHDDHDTENGVLP